MIVINGPLVPTRTLHIQPQEDADANGHHLEAGGDKAASHTQTTSHPPNRRPRNSRKKSKLYRLSQQWFSNPSRKKEYTTVEEKIRTSGRGFGIFHEMWRPYTSIIVKGLEASAADISALPNQFAFLSLS